MTTPDDVIKHANVEISELVGAFRVSAKKETKVTWQKTTALY
jgi:hypothetical protein